MPAVPLGWIGLGSDDHEIGVDAVGDERLGSVEHVLVAVTDGGGGDAGQVGAGAGLGHRDRGDQLTRSDTRQPARRLLVVAVLDEVWGGHVVVERESQPGAPDTGRRELFGDHLVETEVAAAATAVLLGDRHPDEPVATRRAEQLPRRDADRLPFEVVRRDLLGDERRERLTERLVIVGEQFAHVAQRMNGAATGRSWSWRTACPTSNRCRQVLSERRRVDHPARPQEVTAG